MEMDEEDITTWRIKAGYASWVFSHEIVINSKFKSKFVFGKNDAWIWHSSRFLEFKNHQLKNELIMGQIQDEWAINLHDSIEAKWEADPPSCT